MELGTQLELERPLFDPLMVEIETFGIIGGLFAPTATGGGGGQVFTDETYSWGTTIGDDLADWIPFVRINC